MLSHCFFLFLLFNTGSQSLFFVGATYLVSVWQSVCVMVSMSFFVTRYFFSYSFGLRQMALIWVGVVWVHYQIFMLSSMCECLWSNHRLENTGWLLVTLSTGSMETDWTMTRFTLMGFSVSGKKKRGCWLAEAGSRGSVLTKCKSLSTSFHIAFLPYNKICSWWSRKAWERQPLNRQFRRKISRYCRGHFHKNCINFLENWVLTRFWCWNFRI